MVKFNSKNVVLATMYKYIKLTKMVVEFNLEAIKFIVFAIIIIIVFTIIIIIKINYTKIIK